MDQSIIGRVIIIASISLGVVLFVYSIKVPYNINRIANSLEEIANAMKGKDEKKLDDDKKES